MRTLFISYIDINKKVDFGGAQASKRNYSGLANYNDVDLYVIEKKSTLKSIFSLFQRKMPPLLKYDEKIILNLIKEKKYEIVWIDTSMMGSLVKKIKRFYPNVRVFSFFHNVEFDYVKVRIKNKIKQVVYSKIAYKEEKLALIHSDVRVVLSDRDIARLEKLYGHYECKVLPITFKDSLDANRIQNRLESRNRIGLFVGAYGRSNYEGLVWFLKNICSLEDVIIKVVGKDFEKYRDEIEAISSNVKVEVIGSVDNIADYYYEADFVIIPILFGAGMKVKTAEALMYGKSIFGTTEAFAGYSMDFNKIGCCSDNIDELGESIKKFVIDKTERFNKYSREMFETKYSDAISDVFFREIK